MRWNWASISSEGGNGLACRLVKMRNKEKKQSRMWSYMAGSRSWRALAFLLFLTANAIADELYLTDGRVITGKVSQQGGEYVVSFEGGAAAHFPAGEVLRVEKMPTLRERYANLRDVTDENDFKAQMELGNWCRLNNLPDEARLHFKRAIELQPEDQKARQAAGFVRYENKWLTREEVLASQGKVLYKGKEMGIAEADALRQREEEQRLQNEGYSKAWRLLQTLDGTAGNYERNRAELVQMGRLAMGAVLRSTDDGNPRVRALCLDLLGADTTDETRKELFARLRYEERADLVRKVAQQLAKRQERDRILQQTLDWCIRAPNNVTRQRTWLVLRYIGDKRVIPVLLDAVEFCPVPEEQKNTDPNTGKTLPNGWQSSELYEKVMKPYYPACEALNFLTGANIPPHKEAWQSWWKSNEGSFDFTRRGSTAEPAGTAEKKDGKSKKKEDPAEKPDKTAKQDPASEKKTPATTTDPEKKSSPPPLPPLSLSPLTPAAPATPPSASGAAPATTDSPVAPPVAPVAPAEIPQPVKNDTPPAKTPGALPGWSVPPSGTGSKGEAGGSGLQPPSD